MKHHSPDSLAREVFDTNYDYERPAIRARGLLGSFVLLMTNERMADKFEQWRATKPLARLREFWRQESAARKADIAADKRGTIDDINGSFVRDRVLVPGTLPPVPQEFTVGIQPETPRPAPEDPQRSFAEALATDPEIMAAAIQRAKAQIDREVPSAQPNTTAHIPRQYTPNTPDTAYTGRHRAPEDDDTRELTPVS